MTTETFKTLLQKLADSGKVLVAGSYATGKNNENSDIDFLIKTPRHCVLFHDRNENVDGIIEILGQFKIKWNSARTSYISTIKESNDIPIEMEFYDSFHKNKNKLKDVEIMGVKFKTW